MALDKLLTLINGVIRTTPDGDTLVVGTGGITSSSGHLNLTGANGEVDVGDLVVVGNLTQSGGVFSLTGNNSSQISTTTGTLTIDGASGINLGTNNNSPINIGGATSPVTVNGFDITITPPSGGNASGGTPAGNAGDASISGGTGGDATTTVGGTSSGGGTVDITGGIGGDGATSTNPASAGGPINVTGGFGGDSNGFGAGGAGGDTNISGGIGGDGSGATNPGAGGDTTISGGAGGTGGTGNANGGDTTIIGGNASGTGTDGVVNIGTSNTSLITIGATGITTIINGTLSLANPLPVTSGGTGLSTTPTDGQLLIGQTSSSGFVLASLTAGSGISITPGSGTITITATGGGVTQNAATGGISSGQIIALTNQAGVTVVSKANASSGSGAALNNAVAYAGNTAAGGASVTLVINSIVAVPDALWDGGVPAQTSVGQRVYLSDTTSGNSTLTPTATSGSFSLCVGILAAGGTGNASVLVQIGEGVYQ